MTHRPSLSPVRPGPARPLSLAPVALACALALAGCGSDGGTDTPDGGTDTPVDGTRYAFVAGATPVTYDAGQIERLTLGDDIVSSGRTPATESDIRVASDGTDIYQIGRYNLDTLTRFAPDALDTPVWQYSVNCTESAANPYEVVFASETKAYVIRYGSPFVWIVDPTATDEDAFRTGEIDLSVYDVDGVPEASDAILVDGRLFVLMQRLEQVGQSLGAVKESYVAVIDTATDTEIAAGDGADGLDGIRLDVRNAQSLQYLESADEIYVVGSGNYFESLDVPGDPYTGGVATIDPETYRSELLIDDGTAEDNRGFVVDALVLSPTQGYLVTLDGYNEDFSADATLRAFDPLTGLVADGAVAGLEGRDISLLALGPDERLWVGLADAVAPGFTLLDPSDDSVAVEFVPTEFNPNSIVFVDVPTED